MLEVRLLGQFDVCLHGQPVEIPSRPAQSLFSYVILNPGVAYRREMLAGLLWPDATESNARGYLRHALWRTKKALSGDYLLVDNITIAFDQSQEYWLDVSVLEETISENVSIKQLINQVSVYCGELLPGFYDEWIFPQRERLHSIYEHKMDLLLTELVNAERWREVQEWGDRWITTSPASEPAYRAMMQAYSGSGNRAGVAAVYRRCKEALWSELGVKPSELTQQMAQRLMSEDIVTGEPAGVPGQIIDGRARISTLLLTPLVGRQRELKDITEQLEDPACRLLTLMGPGGIGKTRLALETTKQLDYDSYLVPLSSINSSTLLVSTIADVLGLSFYGGQDPQSRLLKYLQDKTLLLILDSMEHLLAGVGLITDMLSHADNIKILVTSRARLELRGEWLYELKGLEFPEFPETNHLEEYSAVELFLRNARRLDPSFSLSNGDTAHVVHICRMVEGLPLAIELASSWVRILSCKDIATELENSLDFLSVSRRDIPSRHRSLRAVFEHSWELLPEKEQEAFRDLSIFCGGFTREAANQIASTSIHTLSSLANRSMIRWFLKDRYFIHQTLCEYGKEILDAQADQKNTVGDRHCRYYSKLIQQQYNGLTSGQQKEALQTIDHEIDNVRAAWRWAVEHSHIDMLAPMLDGLYAFYLSHGWFDEAVRNFDQAAALIRKTDLAVKDKDIYLLLGKVLARLGNLRANLGYYDIAKKNLAESLKMMRECEAPQEIAFALTALGGIAWDLGEYSEALQYHHECEQICRATGYQRGLALSLDSLGFVYMSLGQFAEAKQRLIESLEIFRALGDRMGSASPQGRLGWVAYAEGDFEKAQTCFRQAIAISQEFDNRMVMALDQAGLSVTLNILQQHAQAKEIASECLAVARDIGYQLAIVTALGSLGDALRAEGDLEQARTCLVEGFGVASRLQLMPMCLLLLIVWGSLLADEGRSVQATEVLSLIMHNAGDVKAFAKVAQSRLKELVAELPPDVFTAAKEQGEMADIYAFVNSIVER